MLSWPPCIYLTLTFIAMVLAASAEIGKLLFYFAGLLTVLVIIYELAYEHPVKQIFLA